MQISTRLFYDRASTQMGTLTGYAEKLQSQIATEKKFNAPSDDIVAFSRLSTLARSKADATAFATNVTMAQTLVQQSDSALASIEDRLQRAQELALRASNGTLTDGDRASMATELRGIVDDLVNLANTQDSRGLPLFGAASGTTGVVRAADGSVAFDGTGDPPSIPVSDAISIQPTESAARVFGGIEIEGVGTDMFAVVKGLADALDAGGDIGPAVAHALDGLDASVDHLAGVRASIGARGARLDLEAARATEASTLREADRSSIEDVDITETIAELQKTMTILQATQASFTQLTQLSLFNYIK